MRLKFLTTVQTDKKLGVAVKDERNERLGYIRWDYERECYAWEQNTLITLPRDFLEQIAEHMKAMPQ